ncbi:hypothetical protein F7725_027226 [Dissostichus mawsoni]|uniref:Microtubule-associated protein 1S n=1 Tax=Dissostichus mawsoni TaxID=36200 RepID=A0A7J5XED0_DISMA|nr:hypothetical protein F7725_027226 [Dissostichus mawsoni]
MAAAAVAAERGGGTGGTGAPGGPSPAGASARPEGSSPRPGSAGFSVLVVVGSLRANGLLERLLKQIETGVRCWPVSLDVSVLDQQLKLFVSRHSAFLSQDVPGVTVLGSADPALKAHLTLSCPDLGLWSRPALDPLQDLLTVQVNPPPVLPQMEGLQEFLEYLSESLEPESPFELLEPPSTVGFLKLSRPCCYVFPGGRGGSAFFAVNGFNVLVNGGSDTRSCFWKLVRHLDRIDSVLLTHVGVDNLPGVISLLQRKLLERLSIKPDPLSRSNGPSIEPLILFQKMGVGRLELYPLNPMSKTLEVLMQNWPNGGSNATSEELPISCLASICALLVWHPSSPQEKIIRVLFPGCTPQNRILEGLDKLKHLEFLKHPVVCLKDLESLKREKPPKRAESRESLKSQTREVRPSSALQKDKRVDLKKQDVKTKTKPKTASEAGPKDKMDGEEKPKVKEVDAKAKPPKPAEKLVPKKDGSKEDKKDVKKKDEKVSVKKEENAEKKKEAVKKETISIKPKKDLKPEPKKDGKKDVKTEEKKPAKPASKDVKKPPSSTGSIDVKKPPSSTGSIDGKKAPGKFGSLKKDGTLPKKDSTNKGTKGKQGSKEPEVQKEADRSKVSTPEDMTAEFENLRLENDNGNNSQVNGNSVESPEKFRCSEPAGPVGSDLTLEELNQDPRGCVLENSASSQDKQSSLLTLNHVHGMSELILDVPHDVDLCLVSPCEFQHQHVGPSTSPDLSNNNNNNNVSRDHSSSSTSAFSQETPPTSVSESLPNASDSDVPPCTDDCPSITADSEDEFPPSPLPSHRHDPPPAPVKDLPPLPPQPGACMADSEANKKSLAGKTRKTAGSVQRPGSGGSVTQSGRAKAVGSSTLKTTSSLDTKPSTRNSLGGSRIGAVKPPSSAPRAAGSGGSAGSPGPAVYVDLAYLPSGAASSSVDQDLFRRLRSSYYVISGDDPEREETTRSILEALLEGKRSWGDIQVTLIPTFDSLAMHEWYQETHERQRELSITVLGSNSTVAMQEETFPACKILTNQRSLGASEPRPPFSVEHAQSRVLHRYTVCKTYSRNKTSQIQLRGDLL